jgi:hypothetical protein
LWNILFFIINIFAIIIAYFIILNKIENKVLNRKILDKIKEEVNSIIVQLNEATLNNVNLLEDKIQNLNKRIQLASKKIGGLKAGEDNKNLFDAIISDDKPEQTVNTDSIMTYSPKKIVNQSKKISEEIINEKMNIENNPVKVPDEFDGVKNLSQAEKVIYLVKKGWNLSQIQKKLGLTSGEIELLINMENINRI